MSAAGVEDNALYGRCVTHIRQLDADERFKMAATPRAAADAILAAVYPDTGNYRPKPGPAPAPAPAPATATPPMGRYAPLNPDNDNGDAADSSDSGSEDEDGDTLLDLCDPLGGNWRDVVALPPGCPLLLLVTKLAPPLYRVATARPGHTVDLDDLAQTALHIAVAAVDANASGQMLAQHATDAIAAVRPDTELLQALGAERQADAWLAKADPRLWTAIRTVMDRATKPAKTPHEDLERIRSAAESGDLSLLPLIRSVTDPHTPDRLRPISVVEYWAEQHPIRTRHRGRSSVPP